MMRNINENIIDKTVKGESSPLPPGWRWVRLGDVVEFESGGTPDKGNDEYWGGNIPFVTGADITEFFISAKHARAFLTQAGFDSGKTAICNPGAVLFVTRTRVGRVGIANERMGASQDLSPFKCGPSVIPEFLCWYLLNISNMLISNCRGATIKGLTRTFIRDLLIPLPSVAEQKHIVSVLTEQMAAVERARAAAEAQLDAAKTLSKAYIRQNFDGLKSKGWPRKLLGDVCELNPRKPNIRRADSTLTTFVPMSAVDEYDHSIVSAEERPFREIRRGYTYFAEGDILFAKITPCMQNGKHAIARNLIDGFGFGSTEFHVVRPKEMLSAEWLHLFLIQSWVLEEAKAHFSGAVGQQRVPETYLAGLEIPLPPRPEQHRLLKILIERINVARKMQKSIEADLLAIKNLPAALLRRAFSGEL